MGIQPITGTPLITATLTLTVPAITDIDELSTGHTWATGARTMRGPITAGAIAAPTMPAHTAGVIAGHIGSEERPTQGGSRPPSFPFPRPDQDTSSDASYWRRVKDYWA